MAEIIPIEFGRRFEPHTRIVMDFLESIRTEVKTKLKTDFDIVFPEDAGFSQETIDFVYQTIKDLDANLDLMYLRSRLQERLHGYFFNKFYIETLEHTIRTMSGMLKAKFMGTIDASALVDHEEH